MKLLATIPVVASALMIATGLALIALTPRGDVPLGFRSEEMLPYLVLQAALSGVGALLAWRRPRTVIGWLLSGAGLVAALEHLTAGYAIYGLSSGVLPGALTAAWVYSWAGLGIGLFMVTVMLTFPDGRLRTNDGRAAFVALLACMTFLALFLALRPGPLTRFPSVNNPFGWFDGAGVLLAMLAGGMVCAVLVFVLAIKQLIDRARVATPIERQQLKWFLWSNGLLGVTSLAFLPLFFMTTADNFTVYVVNVLTAVATAALPISIGIAILRYGLYDIDLLIKRTVVYGATSAAIAATFFVGIVALQAVLSPFTAGNELAVAGSTLIGFALFQPVRRRVQDAVDRRFNRARYDASRTLDAFADRLRDEVDLVALRSDLISAVSATMAPAHSSLWLRERTTGPRSLGGP
jgi:hypothetical protein